MGGFFLPIGTSHFRENPGLYEAAGLSKKIPYGVIRAGKRALTSVEGPTKLIVYNIIKRELISQLPLLFDFNDYTTFSTVQFIFKNEICSFISLDDMNVFVVQSVSALTQRTPPPHHTCRSESEGSETCDESRLLYPCRWQSP